MLVDKLDVLILHPEGAPGDVLNKEILTGEAAQCVAMRMESRDYDGNYVVVSLRGMSVRLQAYTPEDTLMTAVYSVWVTGYDYPDRLANLGYRTRGVVTGMHRALRQLRPSIDGKRFNDPDRGIQRDLVEVRFVPLGRGGFASSPL